ncbi:MAG: alpha/beta hydrolase [Chloroflexota bacterium]|nr:alpha/beta hydrolase [Chloroflexota bacterium]
MPVPTLTGIHTETVVTPRIRTRLLSCGAANGVPVLFLHGNASSATYWEATMLALPTGFRALAPDQRAYGDADPAAKIDATRGMADLSDDAAALLDHLGITQAHIVGHSLGGSVIWQMLMDHPTRFLTATLVCPGSPYGYGGTKDLDGTPCYDDFAGSGGGVVNAVFAGRMKDGDRSSDNPQSSPRIVMNQFYWKPPFVPPREEDLLSSLLSAHVGAEDYPGDFVASPNWPNVAPGTSGPSNGLSPKYNRHVERLYTISPKPSVLWVRGSHDQIISDTSLFDIGTLGALGVVPGYPGAAIYPSQPMVGQTRAVLEKYTAAGGQYQEVVIDETGHTPYIEKPDEFNRAFHAFIGG